MTAVGAEHDVFRLERVADRDRDGLLADREVDGTFDFVGRVIMCATSCSTLRKPR